MSKFSLAKLIAKNNELNRELEKYESGYKGSCHACEIVGELNEKLEKTKITSEMVLDAYENEVSNQAIDHQFDIYAVIRELFGEDAE